MRRSPDLTDVEAARTQLHRLQKMLNNLTNMSKVWEELDSTLGSNFNQHAKEMNKQIDVLDEKIRDWSEGHEKKEDE